MRNFLHIIITVTMMVTFLIGCGCDSRHDKLNAIDSLADVQPDSALSLLKSMSKEMESASEATNMYYRLLKVKLEYKCYLNDTDKSDILKVLEYYQKSNDNSKLPTALFYAGKFYTDKGDYPQALEYYQKADELMENPIDSKTRKLKALNSLYIGYSMLDQSLERQASNYFKKSAELSKLNKDTTLLLFAKRDLGNCYKNREIIDSALTIYEEAYKLARKYDNGIMTAEIEAQIAYCYNIMGNYQEATQHIDNAMTQLGNKDNWKTFYSIKAMILASENKLDEAVPYLDQLEKKGNIYNKGFSTGMLTQYYYQKGDIENMMEYYKRNITYTDSISKITSPENIARINALYNYNLKEKEKAKLKNKLERDNLLIISGSVVVTLLLIIIFFVVRIRKKNEAIYKNRIVILESLAEKLKTEVKQLNAIQEALNKKNKTIKILQSDIVNELRRNLSTNKNYIADENVWKRLEDNIDKLFPNFRTSITSICKISIYDFRLCILIKAGFTPTEMAILTCKSVNAISATRRKLFFRAFNRVGAPSDWDKYIKYL